MARALTVVRTMVFCHTLAVAVPALAAAPSVESVAPGAGRTGEEFTLVLTGGHMKDVCELLLYDPGVSCIKLEAVSDGEVRAVLRAAPDCRLGAYPFRLRSRGGLSELKVVHITPFPILAEIEPNDEPKQARTVPLNTTVAGVIDAGDVDCVRVSLKKGQRLSAEVQAVRLGGELTDTVLTVFDPEGRAIAQADDLPITRQDPFVSLVVPAEGTYTLQVRETSFGGGPTSTYALHVGDFPRPGGLFPPGAQAGKPARLALVGTDTDLVAEVTPPADAGPWWPFFPAVDGRTAPTPTELRVRPYPGINEGPPGPHEWPVAVHGTIAKRGETDAFAIRARAGDAIQVEVFAMRIGSPLDSILSIFDPDGDLVARNDDDETHDSRIRFHAERDGTYRIEVRDKRGEGGPGFLYRVEVEAAQPSLALFLAGPVRKSQDRQVIAVPRGNRVLAFLGVRRDGFDDPVRVEMGPLPRGISADLKEIAAGTYLAPVVFEAAPEAPLGAALVDLQGLASTPRGTVTGGFRQVVDLVPGTGDSSYQSVTVRKLAVVVTEAAPYAVRLSAPVTGLARDGAIDLVATVERAQEFHEALEVSLPNLPPGVEMDAPGTVPPDASEVVLRLFARPDAETTSWRMAAEARPALPRRDQRELTLALQAQLNPQAGGRRRKAAVEGMPQVASRFVPLALTAAPISGRFAPAAAEQGKTVTVTCTLEPGPPLPGMMVATLEGLPPRGECKPVPVTPGDRRIAFEVAIAPTTPAGEQETLVCRLTGEFGGRTVVYRVGRAGRLKVSPRGALTTDADGKLLSPLEALRLKERAGARKP
jgi:hypothetical protein